MSGLVVGLTARVERAVTTEDTASALGSGDVPVLATPRLLAWLEAATVAAVAEVLPTTSTTVGTRVEVEHLAASAVGAHVTATAALAHVDGRLLRFEVAAEEQRADGSVVVATGRVTRVVVDRERFLSRL
jgi:predicted thioesterase